MAYKAFACFAAAASLWLAALPATVSGQRGGQPVQLPDGPGKDLVQTTCAKCHGLNLITSFWGNNKTGWHELIGTMVALPKEQADTITTYLATHFPAKPAPEA